MHLLCLQDNCLQNSTPQKTWTHILRHWPEVNLFDRLGT